MTGYECVTDMCVIASVTVFVSAMFVVGWAMTGSAAVGGALALVEPLVNTVAYFLHEKLWERRSRAA